MSNLVKVDSLASYQTGNLKALALSNTQISEKLQSVPVFVIADANGAPLIATLPNQGNSNTSTSTSEIFITPQDARAFVEQLKTRNPQLAALVRVVPVSLGAIYQVIESNKGKPDEVKFNYVPAPQQVESAKTVLRQNGQQVNQYSGVPLFVARGGPDNGYLTIQQGQQEVIPVFFNREELQQIVDRFQQQQPNFTATIKIQVLNLESLLEALRTGNDPFFNQLILIPPRESRDFVRSGSGTIVNLEDLSVFNNLLTASARERFLDLTLGNDLFQIAPNSEPEILGGVRALDGDDTVNGSPFNDVINGNAGNDVLRGGARNDLLRGGKGSDLIFGDDGSDLLSGGQDNDSQSGGNGNDFLRGGRGNDTLNGDEGNDFLLGDAGFDILTGGGGTDIFIIKIDVDAGGRDANFADRITDLNPGDRIAITGNISLDNLNFNAAGANTLILLANGEILANVLNASPATVRSATFIGATTDSIFNLG